MADYTSQNGSIEPAELEDVEVPVLIIGAGPSGATTALLLGRLGIPSLVISRHTGTANTPRAHVFNQRAMEVMRAVGMEEILKTVSSPACYMEHTSWLHSLAGEEYGRMYAFGNRPDRKGEYEIASPCSMSDLPQSILEPILVEHASKVGAEFRFYTEFVSQSATMEGLGVDTTVRERKSNRTYKVHSRYLIGADGARSAVLDSLGIPIDGIQLNTAFNVHIKADLGRFFDVRPGTLNWILNPDAPQWSAVGNCRVVQPWNEFVVSMHPAVKDTHGKPFEPSEADIRHRLHQMFGVSEEESPIEILSSFRWTINHQVARTWQKGNVICIGDAVHRHPPINGLGSNTCISDAMNIAWKLAYVLKELAHASLLNTITPERKPVGDSVVQRANNGMEAHRHLWSVIGLDPEVRLQKTELMAQATVAGRKLRAEFRAAMENTEYEQNGLGIQMNQRYCTSALSLAEPDDQEPDVCGVDVIKILLVSTYPGYHLPHVWIARDGQSHRRSTLDLCDHGAFTLITGIGGEEWRSHAAVVETERKGLVVNVVSIGWRQEYMDAYGDWEKVRGVDDDGAVLIRPDQFVAWRCRTIGSVGARRLLDVFDLILPRF